jgi:hypothetical protein
MVWAFLVSIFLLLPLVARSSQAIGAIRARLAVVLNSCEQKKTLQVFENL